MGIQSIYDGILFKTLMTMAILVSVFYVSFFISRWTRALRPHVRSMLVGVYFGSVSVLLIWGNLSLRSSDIIDVRLVMTSIIATWFGLVPALIMLAMTVAAAIVVYGVSFASGILVLSLASCAASGYLLSRAINAHNKSRKMKILVNLLLGIILSVQTVLWKCVLLVLSNRPITLMESGIHKAVFFLMISYSVGMILMTEREIETKTNALEMANLDLELANGDLNHQKMELQAAYGQLAASEDELKAQNEELITAYDRIAASEEEYEALFNAGNEAIWKIDPDTGKYKYSEKAFLMFGYEPHEADAFDADRPNRRHPDDAVMVGEHEQRLLDGDINQYVIEYRARHRDGHELWVRNKATRLIYRNGMDMGIIGSLLDISEIKAYERKILDMAYVDSLTGLPNRRAFGEWFEQWLASDSEALSHGVLFFVDTDNFKYINDVMGHHVGDDLLRQTGLRLQTLGKQVQCHISRVGGDEFAIILQGEHGHDAIEDMAAKIAHAFATPYSLSGRQLQLTISMGITRFPEDGTTVGKLMKNADIAMYKAKGMGKDGWCHFDVRLEEDASERMQMESHLRKAAENGELSLRYQPQVHILDRRIVGFEALVRWNSPTFGMVSPVRFIPIAEDTGLIIPIGNWILREACLFAKRLNEQEPAERRFVSVNISPLQVMDPGFLDMVWKIIRETGIEPCLLGIEITETALLESFDTVADKVGSLRNGGIHVSLDDFGMGYSSLNHLRTLPIDTVKIDKSFVDDMIRDEKSYILTEEIIRISHKLGADIVAEGVEQEAQVALLKAYGCDAVQGYLFSKPVSQEEALAYRLA